MRELVEILTSDDGTLETLVFYCPGCEGHHGVPVTGDKAWRYNGNAERPTLSPSIRVFGTVECHLFVRDGRLEYCDDAEHHLAGQTVDMTPPE